MIDSKQDFVNLDTMMNWFNLDLKKWFVILVLFGLPLLSVNVQKTSDDSWYNRPFSLIASFLQQGLFKFSSAITGTTRTYLDLIDLKSESQQINEKNRELQTKLLQFEELLAENARLSELLEFKQKTNMELVPARLIAFDPVSSHQTIRINKGSQDGLKHGQAVISTSGAVGTVFHPDLISSQVLLITDTYSVVDGIVARTRSRGIVEGRAKNLCSLLAVEKSEDLVTGDLIVTSGLDNIFPKGLPVATVSGVESRPFSVSLKVTLRPVVNPNLIEEVFVVKNAGSEDFMSDSVSSSNSEGSL